MVNFLATVVNGSSRGWELDSVASKKLCFVRQCRCQKLCRDPSQSVSQSHSVHQLKRQIMVSSTKIKVFSSTDASYQFGNEITYFDRKGRSYSYIFPGIARFRSEKLLLLLWATIHYIDYCYIPMGQCLPNLQHCESKQTIRFSDILQNAQGLQLIKYTHTHTCYNVLRQYSRRNSNILYKVIISFW